MKIKKIFETILCNNLIESMSHSEKMPNEFRFNSFDAFGYVDNISVSIYIGDRNVERAVGGEFCHNNIKDIWPSYVTYWLRQAFGQRQRKFCFNDSFQKKLS